MPEWLRLAVNSDDPLPPIETIVTRMVIALLCGLCVSALYRATLGRGRKNLRTLPTTLVLLAVLIAVVTLVIGNNVARAFGLVGALSIVRFRTVVEDTGDTSFVIFAVTLGMAVGSGCTTIAVISLPSVALATLIMSQFDRRSLSTQPVVLVARCGIGLDPNVLLAPAFAVHAVSHTLMALETAAKGTTLEAKFSVRLREPGGLLGLLNDVLKIDGVQGAELKQPS